MTASSAVGGASIATTTLTLTTIQQGSVGTLAAINTLVGFSEAAVTAAPDVDQTTDASAYAHGFDLDIDTSGHIHLVSQSVVDSDTGIVLSAGTTYHLVVNYDGYTFRLYLNGVKQYTLKQALSGASATGVVRIGSGYHLIWQHRDDHPS